MRNENKKYIFWKYFMIWIILILFLKISGLLLWILIAAGPFLILVITILNLFFIIKNNKYSYYKKKDFSKDNKDYLIFLVVCSAKIIKANGTIDFLKRDKVKEFFVYNYSFDSKSLLWIEEILDKELAYNRSIVSLSMDINRILSYSLKISLVDFLFQLATTSGLATNLEKNLLEEFVRVLQITNQDYKYLKIRYFFNNNSNKNYYSSFFSDINKNNNQREKYCKIMEIGSDANQEEIKAQYRKLAKRFHPDVVAHLGEKERKLAEIKMKQIQEAYEFLKEM
jgi:DnaJ like chaperone protein